MYLRRELGKRIRAAILVQSQVTQKVIGVIRNPSPEYSQPFTRLAFNQQENIFA
jgi:hypothetical protein